MNSVPETPQKSEANNCCGLLTAHAGIFFFLIYKG